MEFVSRASTFNNLDWVRSQDYLDAIVDTCLPCNRVLDVGCGTWQIARALAPKVRQVIGIDISLPMMAQGFAQGQIPSNVRLQMADARDMSTVSGTFDCIVARMVFHHITDRLEDAVSECYRMLESGGKIVVAEGVPPHPSLKDWYASMFALKEERLTFLPEDLVKLLGGFKAVTTSQFIQKGMSLKNWLDNGGVPEENKALIWKMHTDLNEIERGYYNMVETEDDILMDWITCIVKGTK